jgi:hypothetical protein
MAVARRDIKKRVGSAKPRATWENVIRKRDVGGCQKGKVSCFSRESFSLASPISW